MQDMYLSFRFHHNLSQNLPVTTRRQPIKKHRGSVTCPHHTVRVQPLIFPADCLGIGGKGKAGRGDRREMVMFKWSERLAQKF